MPFLKKSMSHGRRYLVSFCSLGCPVDLPWDEDACLGAGLAHSCHFIAVSSLSWRIMLVSYKANQGWNTDGFLVSWVVHRLLWGNNRLCLHVVSILCVSVLPEGMYVHLCCLCYPWGAMEGCEPLCGCWEVESGSPEQILLLPEPYLPPHLCL